MGEETRRIEEEIEAARKRKEEEAEARARQLEEESKMVSPVSDVFALLGNMVKRGWIVCRPEWRGCGLSFSDKWRAQQM